jgi:hypothetical protein
MTTRVKCLRCDNQILEATARRNHGLCAICKSNDNSAAFEAAVQGWIDNPATLPGTNGIPEPRDIALALAARQLKSRLYPTADDRMEFACHKFFDVAHAKWSRRGPSALSDKERHVLAVETFYGEVNNGGLIQYLGNESGAFAGWAAEAFDAIGIPELADLMRNVQSLFPHGVIPEDPAVRWDLVEAIGREQLEALKPPSFNQYFTDSNEIRRKLFDYLNK